MKRETLARDKARKKFEDDPEGLVKWEAEFMVRHHQVSTEIMGPLNESLRKAKLKDKQNGSPNRKTIQPDDSTED